MLKRISSLRWFHVVLTGLCLGLSLATWLRLQREDELVGGVGFAQQTDFERDVASAPVDGLPVIKNIVFHPRSSEVDLITYDRLVEDLGVYASTKLAASRPYTPAYTSRPPSDHFRIADFITQMSSPATSVRYAWWEETTPSLTIWSGGLTILLTSFWGAVRLFHRSMVTEESDAKRVAPSPVRSVGGEAPETGAGEATAELCDALLATLTAGDVPSNSVAKLESEGARSAAPSELQLEASPIASIESDEPPKSYSGEYYPVSRVAAGAFSLAELVVVMGVILLIISLLLPSTIAARRRAETTYCASNLRQLGIGFQMYANSNGGWLPEWSGWHTWPPGLREDTAGPAWTIALTPYLGTPTSKIYHCPAYQGKVPWRNYFLSSKWAGVSGKPAMRMTDITQASRFVLGGDKTQRSLYPRPFGTSDHAFDDADPDDFGDRPVLAWPWEPGGFFMHRAGNNVLFDDGHVAIADHFDPARMTFNPRRIENWDGVTPD